MERILYNLSVARAYTAQYLKTKISYRADFFLELTTDLLQQLVSLVFILVVYNHVPQIAGWSQWELLLIYGFFMIPYALFNVFFSELPMIRDSYIIEGNLDRVLLRPVNTLLQIILELMELEYLFGILIGGMLMSISAHQLAIGWAWYDPLLVLLLSLAASLIYGGVFLILAATGFWVEGRTGVAPLIYNLIGYGRYPVNIYRGVVRFVLTWVLPFAFVGFYPATLFLHRPEYLPYVYLTPLMGILSFWLGYQIWLAGLKRYRGTGS